MHKAANQRRLFAGTLMTYIIWLDKQQQWSKQVQLKGTGNFVSFRWISSSRGGVHVYNATSWPSALNARRNPTTVEREAPGTQK